MSVHQFPAKKFLQATIRVKGTLRRVILHEMNSCPIGDCNAGMQEFSQQRIIAHVQKDTHKPSAVFDRAIQDGYYFWWPQKLSNSMPEDEQISTAFTNPEKKEAAIDRIVNTPEAMLDPMDGAEYDIPVANDDNDSYELEEQRIEATAQIATEALVDEATLQYDTQNADSNSIPTDNTEQPSDPSPSPTIALTNMPNLDCPLALLQHNFAILHLPDFEGTPAVPACISCRTIINSGDHLRLRQHRCNIDNTASTHTPPSNPSAPLANDEAPDDVDEHSNLPGVNALDPSDVPPIGEEDGLDDDRPPQSTYSSWRDIREYLQQNKDNIVKVGSRRPTHIISVILFLPIKKGYGCPIHNCPHAFEDLNRAQRHVQKHTLKVTAGPTGEYTEPTAQSCSMQTLGALSGKASYFRVSPSPCASPTAAPVLSAADFMAQSFDQFTQQEAHVGLRGLPFKTPFFKRFDYQSIYPVDQREYTKFVASRINHLSASHNRKQNQRHQLLAMVALVYTRTGGHHLSRGSHLVRRHLGNKLSSDQLGSITSRAFSNLQQTSSILRYSSFFASLVAYVMDVAIDPTIDPELILDPQHKTTALLLHDSISLALDNHTLRAALPLVRNLTSDAIYAPPPKHFNAPNLNGIIVDNALGIQAAYHRLAFAIVKYPRFIPPDQNIFRSPVHRFLALSAWNIDHHVFMDVVPLHNIMAHLQWSMRMVVYQESRRLTEDTPDEDPIPTLTMLKDECASQDATTPFGLLQDQIRYAGVLTTQYTVVPNATFDKNTSTAWLNGISIRRNDAHNMFHETKKQLYHILDTKIYKHRRKDIFVASNGPEHSFDRSGPISDVTSSPHFGYSYLTTNDCFKKHRHGLRNLIVHDPEFRKHFLQPFIVYNKPVWNLTAITQWVTDVDHFKSLLAALVYWLSGMPARGVEFVGTLIHNITNARRNIYCAQGDLVIEHTYSKSEASTGHSRPVMRQPPHDLQRALEEYIVVVKDLYDSFVAILHGDTVETSPEYRALLWTYHGRPMKTEHLSHSLRTISLKYLGFPIGIRPWRQYMLQFAHHLLPLAIVHLPLTVTVLSSQASHGPVADQVNYDRQTDTTFAQVNSSQFSEYQCISLAWGEAWGFPHPTKKSGATLPGETSSIRQETQFITSEISSRINLTLQPMLDDSVARAVAATTASNVISSPSSCRFVPLDIAVTSRALRLVNKLHNTNSGFRSPEQAMCIQYVMDRGPTPLFVVHPMGHGKSSIYLAPMMEEQGSKTTLLIVPLLALAQSAQTVASSHGFEATFFNPSEKSPEGKQELATLDLVIMTYDLLVMNPTIVSWLREMVLEGRLSRIVVDEAHTLVTEEHYRDTFTRVHATLATFSVPHIFLSGTMPESCCLKILDSFQNYKTVFLSRLPGDRINLGYLVDLSIKATNDSIETFALRVKTELFPKLAEDIQDRILIFSRTIAWAEQIAQALSCRAYTSREDLESKQEQLEEWLSSSDPGIEHRILVGTSCISLGVDQPNVRHVWFYGDPHDAITFIQTASRAGRNGKNAFVRLFPIPHSGPFADKVLEDHKTTTLCRRTPFSLLLDGRRITCAALPQAVPCDNCTDQSNPPTLIPHPAALMVPTVVQNIRNADYTSLVVALFSALHILSTDCCFCMLSGSPGGHSWQQCTSMEQLKLAQLKAALQTVNTRSAIPHLAICTQCHIPQKGGHCLGMDDHGKTYDIVAKTCGYVDTSLAIMLAILNSPTQTQRLLQCTPSERAAQVLPSILSPVNIHPCSKSDTGRQLLRYHYIIIAAVAETPYSSTVVADVYNAPWFTPWNRPMAPEDVHNSLLSSINLVGPTEQPQLSPNANKKRGPTAAPDGRTHPTKKPRPNTTLGDADLIPRQWVPNAITKPTNSSLPF